jgi:AhpD family alkylhydroperoxidase
MPRIAALKPEQVPADSKPTLDAFTKNIGFTPNMMSTFALSPIAFNSWATLLGSLSKALDAKTRDSIGLAVSKVNGCNYCLTVHSFTTEHMAKLPTDEIILARKGHATDPKRDAAIQSHSGRGCDGLLGRLALGLMHPCHVIAPVRPGRLDRSPVHRHLHVSLMAIVI